MKLNLPKLFQHRSRKGGAELAGLWIDEARDREKRLARVDADLQAPLRKFVADGYVIFRKLIPDETIDCIVNDTQRCLETPEGYVVRNAGKYVDPASLSVLGRGDRVIDLYGVSAAARAAILHPTLCRFLGAIFDDPPIAMQSLSFNYGSQQAVHQDTAYVISSKPLHLAASWIALEDVQPGSGELVYYPGSHRFDHFLFDNEHKGWLRKTHGEAQHREYLEQLHAQAKTRGIELEHFRARKGDVLIWHADLAHGGATAEAPERTRKSLVAHYCPRHVKPKYHDVVGAAYHERAVLADGAPAGYFTSRHYQLKALETAASAPIYYDGGVSQAIAQAPKA